MSRFMWDRCWQSSSISGVMSSGWRAAAFATVGLGQDPLQRRLFLWVVAGTIPAVALGLFLKLGGYLDGFRSTDLVATNLIIFGVLLGLADRLGRQEKRFEDLTLRDAILVGIAQGEWR